MAARGGASGGGGAGGFDLLSLNPVLWLKLNDGSGTTPQDSSGNGNHGAFINTPTWVAGPPAALDFSSADRDAVQVSGTLGGPAAVTLMAWVDFDAADSSGADVISIADSVLIRLEDGSMQGWYRGAGGGYTNINHADILGGDGWHHVAYVTTAGRQELYLDGVSVAAGNTADAIGYLAGNTLLGRHSTELVYDYDGRMRDALVFPSALTTGEIAAVMAATA
jgi:hypothetical protein